jgi:hypothetical protein
MTNFPPERLRPFSRTGCLRPNLYRDTAPVHFTMFIYREKDSITSKLCTAIPTSQSYVGQSTQALTKICTGMAKSTPYPPCLTGVSQAGLHRDIFLPKVPGPCPDAARPTEQSFGRASGNTPPLQAGSPLERGRLFTKIA